MVNPVTPCSMDSAILAVGHWFEDCPLYRTTNLISQLK